MAFSGSPPIRERMLHPTILPFPDVDHLGHLLLDHQELYLPILQVGMQLLPYCHATPIVCQDLALFVNGPRR